MWWLHISKNCKEKRLNKGKYCEKTTKNTEKKIRKEIRLEKQCGLGNAYAMQGLSLRRDRNQSTR